MSTESSEQHDGAQFVEEFDDLTGTDVGRVRRRTLAAVTAATVVLGGGVLGFVWVSSPPSTASDTFSVTSGLRATPDPVTSTSAATAFTPSKRELFAGSGAGSTLSTGTVPTSVTTAPGSSAPGVSAPVSSATTPVPRATSTAVGTSAPATPRVTATPTVTVTVTPTSVASGFAATGTLVLSQSGDEAAPTCRALTTDPAWRVAVAAQSGTAVGDATFSGVPTVLAGTTAGDGSISCSYPFTIAVDGGSGSYTFTALRAGTVKGAATLATAELRAGTAVSLSVADV